jgi:hypothetical protein
LPKISGELGEGPAKPSVCLAVDERF